MQLLAFCLLIGIVRVDHEHINHFPNSLIILILACQLFKLRLR